MRNDVTFPSMTGIGEVDGVVDLTPLVMEPEQADDSVVARLVARRHIAHGTTCGFDNTGKLLLYTTCGMHLVVWHISSGRCAHINSPFASHGWQVAIQNGGQIIAYIVGDARTGLTRVHLYDIPLGRIRDDLVSGRVDGENATMSLRGCLPEARGKRVHIGGTFAAVLCKHTVDVYDLQSLTLCFTTAAEASEVLQCHVAHSVLLVLTASHITVWNAHDGALVHDCRVENGLKLSRCRLAPGGDHYVMANIHGTLVVDCETGHQDLLAPPAKRGDNELFAFGAPGGELMLYMSAGPSIATWRDNAIWYRRFRPDTPVFQVVTHGPDARLMAGVSVDTIMVYDTSTPAERMGITVLAARLAARRSGCCLPPEVWARMYAVLLQRGTRM